jgi:hypothetical protein
MVSAITAVPKQRILAGLDQKGVDAAGDQAAALLGQGIFERLIGDMPERGQLGAGTDRTENEAGAAKSVWRGPLPRSVT